MLYNVVLMIKLICSSNQTDPYPPPPFFPSTMKSLTCGVPTSQLLLVMSENKNNPSLIY